MGVTSKSLAQNTLNEILLGFNNFRLKPNSETLLTTFGSFWLKLLKDERFIDDFKIVKKNIGKKVCYMAAFINSWLTKIQPEARARMLTDYILTQLMVFVDKYLGLVQFMFLELLLSSSSFPVPIMHGNTATLLTGSVDYAIVSSADKREALAKTLVVKYDEVEDSGSWRICNHSPG